VSTDYVFNGEGTIPYIETDPVDPVNAYGASKQKGEELILQANADAVIVRTSWVYCQHGNNFVKTMLRLMKERPSINVVSDQIGCPTYAIDLAEALASIAISENIGGGIYHFSNSGPISWYDFAVAIKEIASLSCEVNPIPTSSYPTPAKRPHYSVISNEKIQQEFGISQKVWKERLRECIGLLT
jgi:dTDP-4-dehydrorhamnose reductase